MKKTKIIIFFVLGLSIFSFTENTFSSNTTSTGSTGVYCDSKDAFCLDKKTKPDLKVDKNLEDLVGNTVIYFLGFLYLISVIYGMYGAYNILTAASDDEKVEKGKKIIIRAVLGIIVIFSSSIIARFIFGDGTENGKTGIFENMDSK